MRAQTKVEPIILGKDLPPGRVLLAHRPKAKGHKAQKRLVYRNQKGELKASVDGQPVKTVAPKVIPVAKPITRAELERLAIRQRKSLRSLPHNKVFPLAR
jgi:hypothetical protein